MEQSGEVGNGRIGIRVYDLRPTQFEVLGRKHWYDKSFHEFHTDK